RLAEAVCIAIIPFAPQTGGALRGSSWRRRTARVKPPSGRRSGGEHDLERVASLEDAVALEGLVELHAVGDDRGGVDRALPRQRQHRVPAADHVGGAAHLDVDALGEHQRHRQLELRLAVDADHGDAAACARAGRAPTHSRTTSAPRPPVWSCTKEGGWTCFTLTGTAPNCSAISNRESTESRA